MGRRRQNSEERQKVGPKVSAKESGAASGSHCRLLSRSLVLSFSRHHNQLESLLKQIFGPGPGVAESVGLGYVLRICISHQFPGDADAAGLGTALENH